MIQRSNASATSVQSGESPVRTCVGCRRRALNCELLRVVAVDGRVVADVRRRLPGRGAWLHPDPECLETARRRRAFPRALRVPGNLDADDLDRYVDGRLGTDRV